MIFAMQKTVKTVTPSDVFADVQKTLRFKFKHFLKFTQKHWKIKQDFVHATAENKYFSYGIQKTLCFKFKRFLEITQKLIFATRW